MSRGRFVYIMLCMDGEGRKEGEGHGCGAGMQACTDTRASAHYYADKNNSNNNVWKFSCQIFSHSSSSKPEATGAQRRREEKAHKVVLMARSPISSICSRLKRMLLLSFFIGDLVIPPCQGLFGRAKAL